MSCILRLNYLFLLFLCRTIICKSQAARRCGWAHSQRIVIKSDEGWLLFTIEIISSSAGERNYDWLKLGKYSKPFQVFIVLALIPNSLDRVV
ncbi:hypothetical protein O6H91_07G124100 [Diphasiastrum complanatum]|uniref:Uncharacterized protein n=1 Tax=Diphasiastrum complanatum TaxID=34168 RepID=A0ACC2D977_DIPCM|nr:hypothetical protein O6H91_07G124100 [Diphasiastrum complanatum]